MASTRGPTVTTGQVAMFSEWACDECHDTGRIREVWGWTPQNRYGNQGRAYGCPNGCSKVPWGNDDMDAPYERLIKHPKKPILGAPA